MNSSSYKSIRIASFLLVAASGLVIFFVPRETRVAAAGNSTTPRQPVLVELFTSEGCSSCPPADAVLASLDASQPVTGAHVIVLSEHVTYWNNLGWRDPFSSDAMTQRQHDYASRFGLDSVYTPQAVVDGSAEMVGSDERRLTRAIAQSAATPKAQLAISEAHWSGSALEFSLQGSSPSGSVLMAALAEDSVQSSVARGENGGRTLRHVAVVRVMQDIGQNVQGGQTLTLHPPVSHESGPMRLVVFEADRRTGRVVAAAEQTVNR